MSILKLVKDGMLGSVEFIAGFMIGSVIDSSVRKTYIQTTAKDDTSKRKMNILIRFIFLQIFLFIVFISFIKNVIHRDPTYFSLGFLASQLFLYGFLSHVLNKEITRYDVDDKTINALKRVFLYFKSLLPYHTPIEDVSNNSDNNNNNSDNNSSKQSEKAVAIGNEVNKEIDKEINKGVINTNLTEKPQDPNDIIVAYQLQRTNF